MKRMILLTIALLLLASTAMAEAGDEFVRNTRNIPEELVRITANVYLDDNLIYSCKDFRMTGNAVLTISTPFEILRGDEGVHEVKIALICQPAEETELSYILRQLSSLENRVRQIEKGFNNEIAVDDVVHVDLMPAIGDVQDTVLHAFGTPEDESIAETIHLELTALVENINESAVGEVE